MDDDKGLGYRCNGEVSYVRQTELKNKILPSFPKVDVVEDCGLIEC